MSRISFKDYIDENIRAANVIYDRYKARKAGTKPRIVIETMPDDGGYPYFQVFHTNERISDRRYFDGDFRDGQLQPILDRNPVPSAVNQFVTELYAVDGIEKVHLDVYEVTLYVGKAFTWQQVEPSVTRIIKRHLGWFGNVKVERIEKHYGNCRHGK